MDTEKIDYIFKFFNILFSILTFGWVAEILFFITLLIGIFSVLILFTKSRIISYLFADRIYFAKSYLYHYFKQKIFFLKSFFHIVRTETIKFLWYLLAFLIFGGFILFILIKYVF